MDNYKIALKIGLLFIASCMCCLTYAQQDSTKQKRKLFVGFNLISLTNVDDNSSLVVGGRAGFYIGKKFFFGGRAALVQLNERNFTTIESPEFGYIGPMLGYHIWRNDRLQASLSASGGLAIADYTENELQVRDRALFILPTAELEYLLSKNIGLALEVGYRSVQRANNTLTDAQLSGMEFGIALKFGRRP